jgi:hypothetical protein
VSRTPNQRMEASQEDTPQEPGNVEGPYEVDNFSWGHRTHGELKDLLNTRHQAGFDLVSHTALSGYNSSVLIWKKRND